jgi:hypothetical protein
MPGMGTLFSTEHPPSRPRQTGKALFKIKMEILRGMVTGIKFEVRRLKIED